MRKKGKMGNRKGKRWERIEIGRGKCEGWKGIKNKKIKNREKEKGREEEEEKKKSFTRNQNYSTRTSRVVTHRTTIRAGTCLTSQIGRDAVFSRSYGRRWSSMRFEQFKERFSTCFSTLYVTWAWWLRFCSSHRAPWARSPPPTSLHLKNARVFRPVVFRSLDSNIGKRSTGPGMVEHHRHARVPKESQVSRAD